MKYRKKYRNFLRPNEKHRRGDIKVVHDESSRLFPRQHLTFHPFLVPCASIKIPELLLAISTEFMGSTILFISRPSSSLHSLSLPSSFLSFFFLLPLPSLPSPSVPSSFSSSLSSSSSPSFLLPFIHPLPLFFLFFTLILPSSFPSFSIHLSFSPIQTLCFLLSSCPKGCNFGEKRLIRGL